MLDLRQPDNIAHFLSGIDFPCSRDDLIGYARMKNAPDEVLEIIKNMPDVTYYNMADVFKGVGRGE